MITLEATYSKKLGLPNFSSHCYVVSLSTELTDLSQVEAESARLYALLQDSVDTELKTVGYLPEPAAQFHSTRTNGHPAHSGRNGGNGRQSKPADQHNITDPEDEQQWACSDKQRTLILRIVRESSLDKHEVEEMAQQLFGTGVKDLDKLQASQLIEDLLEKTGKKTNRGSRWRQPARA
jgi:hypothetical protein